MINTSYYITQMLNLSLKIAVRYLYNNKDNKKYN